MTERRGGEQGFAVATQSITGGRRARGGGPRGPRRIGVLIVLVGSLGLILVGFLGPRISGLPNFDIGYFATPTPRDSPTPSPTPTFPNRTPQVTPLPTLTRPDGAPALDGTILLGGNGIERLDLATGERTFLTSMTAWQDGLVRLADDRVACVCIVDGYADNGPTRTVKLISVGTGATITTELATYSVKAGVQQDQPDPLFDVAVDRAARSGLLASATRDATGWRLALRAFDPRAEQLGPETALGSVPLPPSIGPSLAPTPSDAPPNSQVYFDGPHLRISQDGRTAVLWALAQRYSDSGDATTTRGAWRIRLGDDGSIVEAVPAPELLRLPLYCTGTGFLGADRLVAVCGEQDPKDPSGKIRWLAHGFDTDGRETMTVELPTAGDYGYGEPLFDDANRRLFLWDPMHLSITRLDATSGAIATATFDPADSATAGVTSAAAPGPPLWHDADSSVQQGLFEQLAGSRDGTRLYVAGFQVREGTDVYGQRSLGVFVIDSATLALLQHWAPVANDTSVTILADGRVAVAGQPGMNAAGDQVAWDGSLTIRDAADGTIVARYGRVSTDMPPVVIRP